MKIPFIAIAVLAPAVLWLAPKCFASNTSTCIADTRGSGWVCAERIAQTPRRVQPSPSPVTTTPSKSTPDDLYVPTPTRPVAATHNFSPGMAARYAQRDGARQQCTYEQREYPLPLETVDEEQLIVAEADSLQIRMDEAASLLGNVTIDQGNRRIDAPRAELDQNTRVVTFPAGVRIDQPGLILQGETAAANLNTKEAQFDQTEYLLTDVSFRGEATVVHQSPEGHLTLTDNSFTRCEPGNNGWRLDATELDIKKGEVFGTAKNAVLRLKSIPIFYSPRMEFPVSDERLTGFLFPTLSYSSNDGADVSLPFYANLAPNYDATIIPRYISKRGVGSEAEFRHLSGWQATVVSGAYLPNDDLYNGEVDRDDYRDAGGEAAFGPFKSADRWLGAIKHDGRIGRFRTFVDYVEVSDRDYFSDLSSELGGANRRELERRGGVQYRQGGLSVRLWAQAFQRLDEVLVDEYKRVPELEVMYNQPLVGPLALDLKTTWSEFDRDTDNLNGIAAITGSRTHFEPHLVVPFDWPFGFLRFDGGWRYTAYDLDQDPNAGGVQLSDATPTRSVGVGSVDGGLFFERDLNWFNQPLLQTLEPRIYYLWHDFEDQSLLPQFDTSELTFGYSQLYRNNRFSGLDRFGDANQATVGVTTRFLSRLDGTEYFRFSLGQIFYFDDRRVTLNGLVGPDEAQSSSAIAAEMAARVAGNWYARGTIVWDPHDDTVDEGGIGIGYRRDNRHIFNLGYRKRIEQNIDQTDASVYWPLFDKWAVIGRWNYDLVSNRTIEGFAGLEFADCCLRARLIARRYLDSDNRANADFADIEADKGIFLQIVFKGLAGFGTKIESILERGVRGYRRANRAGYFAD